VELGYVTSRGQFVVTDTLGLRTIFPAYTINPRVPSFEFLSRSRPMEFVADVHVAVDLHRGGWTAPGKPFLQRTSARLYRVGALHVLIGPRWKSLRIARRGDRTHVRYPIGSSQAKIKKARGVTPPPRDAPLVGFLEPEAVRGARRRGGIVELFAVERKERSDFQIGKLKATIEFDHADDAAAFANPFPRTTDVKSLDETTTLDVERSKRLDWNGRLLLGLFVIVLLYALGIFLALYSYQTGNQENFTRAIGSIWTFSALVAWASPDVVWNNRKEVLDFIDKWPVVPPERWTKNEREHTARFAMEMAAMGNPVEPTMRGLAALDQFFRSLPPETYHPPFARDAGGFVGVALRAWLRDDVTYRWRYIPDRKDFVLWIDPIEYWLAPHVILAKVWEGKHEDRLDERIRENGWLIESRLAFREIAPFQALGHLPQGWDGFESAIEPIVADLRAGPSNTYLWNGERFLVHRARHGPFLLRYTEAVIRRDERQETLPIIAIPFDQEAPTVRARLERTEAKETERLDAAVVHIEGTSHRLPVVIANYLAVVADLSGLEGAFDLRLMAVAPRLRVVPTPTSDRLAPRPPSADRVSVSWADVRGRVTSVRPVVNPLHNTALWRIGLVVSNFAFQVLVRKDACEGTPAVGKGVEGACWLAAEFPSRVSEEETEDGAEEEDDEDDDEEEDED